jgi:hypothetical protein
MSLTEYPTPRTEEAWAQRSAEGAYSHEKRKIETCEQLEREAAAWKAVTEKLYARVEADRYCSYNGVESDAAMKAFYTLKSQLEKP